MQAAILKSTNKNLYIVIFYLFFGGLTAVAQDLVVDSDITLSGTTEVDNVNYTGQSHLTINGTLVVRGNFSMEINKSSLTLGEGARLIVFGDFIADNQVYITLGKDSYLIVYGSFTKGGASNQDVVIIDNAKIYILGEDNNWGDNFTSCDGSYDGSTSTVDETCDFGKEDDFEDNQDDFPDDLVDLINCYDLSSVSATPACAGGASTLSLDNNTLTDVTYEWQVKSEGSWSAIGSTPSVTVSNIQDFTKEYRVIVRPVGESDCRISISRNIQIERVEGTIWTGTAGSDWNNPANWSCNSLPTLNTDILIPSGLTNYPVVSFGANALAKNITLEASAGITVTNNWLRIAGDLMSSGLINAESGGISFEGANSQVIPAGTFTNHLVQDLEINNDAGVISQSVINLTNSLKISKGNFQTGNSLTLISDSTTTAFIDGSGGGSISGTIRMQRYLPSGFGYKYFSSPFRNSVVGDFATFMNLVHPTTGFPHFYIYNENREHTTGEDLSGWEAYTGALSALTSGNGYAANISDINSPVTVELSGEVVSGNVSLSLQNNNGTYTKGFNLVGNPYPSPVDWNLVTKNGIDDAIYFFTAGSGDRYTGSYTSFVNGVSSDGRSSNIIPSMQGFFVKVSSPGSTGTLSFTDAARVGNSTQQTFYQAKRTGIQSKIVVTAGFKKEDKQDHLVLYSFPGATINFEKEYDAQKLFNTSLEIPSFYSLTPAREKLSINAVSGFEKTTTTEISLGYKARKSGEMTMDLTEFPATLGSPEIYLKDKAEKVLWNLTNGKYSFSTQKGDFNSRFSLVLSPNELTSQDMEEAFRSFEIQISAGEILVKSKLSEGVDGEIQLSNPTGKILQLRSVSGKEEINFSGLQTGIYFVTLRTRENKETRKILVQQ